MGFSGGCRGWRPGRGTWCPNQDLDGSGDSVFAFVSWVTPLVSLLARSAPALGTYGCGHHVGAWRPTGRFAGEDLEPAQLGRWIKPPPVLIQ